jgi:3-oxoacyl-[acyl-carrier-protein] synthase-3
VLAQRLNQAYYLTTVKLLKRLLTESGIRVSDVVRLLPHNMNHPGWRSICGMLRLPETRLFTTNISRKGHVYGCDAIINLVDLEQDEGAQPGPIVVYSMGYGACFGALLLDAFSGQAS